MTGRALSGACHCGAVRVEARLPTGDVHACHCTTCRTWSGGVEFGIDAESVIWTGEDAISVYRSSDWAERGFCARCGTHLFYRMVDTHDWSINPFLDADISGLALVGEVFVDEQPGFYSFAQATKRQTGAELEAEYHKRANQDAGGDA
ncbi:MAG: GFA family protein [Pseudomonadota bacterium]